MKKTSHIYQYIHKSLPGWTDADFSEKIGIESSTVCRYKTGKTEPSPETCKKIARLISQENKGKDPAEVYKELIALRIEARADKEGVADILMDVARKLAKTGTFTIGVAMFILISTLHTTPASASNSLEGVHILFDNNIHYATLRRWFKRWFGLTPRSTLTLQLA